ncbi:MAG: histidine kinase, partial [Clostridiaceae bacterium]|nr:histidine kinase [Clostridiaceae bacterium]
AKQEEGKLHWIPTYDYSDMFNISYIKDLNVDYRYMFSVVEMIGSSIYDGSEYVGFDSDTERPILIINYKEDFFQKVFNNSIPIEGSNYYVITKEGQIVSHKDQSKITSIMSIPLLNDMRKKGSGTDIITIDREKMLICYDTSRVTEWISVAMIPLDRLLSQVLPALRLNTVFTAMVVIIISIVLSYLITDRITKPIKILTQATKNVGDGNFGERIKEVGSNEFKELIHTFNSMNKKIQKLITENYEIKIRETEAEITALNLQLDPHFMYNALNLISLVSIRNQQDEISDMIVSLSKMLKYTVKNKKDIVPFKEDMEYLQGYINIMSKRFDGKFKVKFNIEESLYFYSVPKFFMQPFVENSIVHGFDSVKSGGVLKISGWIDDDSRCFIIEDNGKGMDEQRIHEILQPDSSSIGIKNVDKRIKILYGGEFGVKIKSILNRGTRVEIKLPLENAEENIRNEAAL